MGVAEGRHDLDVRHHELRARCRPRRTLRTHARALSPADSPADVTLLHAGRAFPSHRPGRGQSSSSGQAGVDGPGALVARRPTRAARRWRRRRRRCRRAGRRARRTGAGTVAIVKSRGLDVVDLVPRDRRRHRRLGHAAHRVGRCRWCGRGRSGCSRRTARRGSRSLRHHVVVTSSGARRSTSRAKASAARRTSREAVRRARSGRRRAGPCRPRSSASRPRRARRAPRARRGRPAAPWPSGQSGIGSRSMRHSSGFSMSARREFHGWNSTVDICTAQITLGQLGRRTARRRAARSAGSAPAPSRATAARRRAPASGAPSPRSRPSGNRCSMHGRSRSALTMPGADGEVVVGRGRAWSRRVAGKYTRSGLEIRTVRSPTSSSIAGALATDATVPARPEAI